MYLQQHSEKLLPSKKGRPLKLAAVARGKSPLAMLTKKERSYRPLRPAKRLRGFTVTEVVIAVAMMAILAAVTLPAVTSYLHQQDITTTASTLADLQNSITTFKANVGNYPSRLTHLAKLIATTDTTSCTGRVSATPLTLYPAGTPAKWQGSAPYYPKAMSDKGFPLPIGTARDTLFRTVPSLTTGFLQIKIPSVRFQDADALNDEIDGPADLNQANRSNTTGTLQWTVPNATDRVDVTYWISVSRVC
jgi:prepilin-type N-terminal cleavage/methylation domain-containing protein